MKRNRTLLSLSLSGNRIGDDGVNELAQVLSRFSLTHVEIVSRRKQLLEKKADEVRGICKVTYKVTIVGNLIQVPNLYWTHLFYAEYSIRVF